LDEANRYCEQADLLFRILRRFSPFSKNPDIDASLDDLEVFLKELKEALAAEESEDDEDTMSDDEAAIEEGKSSEDPEE
jgi:hypothetical protein